MADSLSAAVTLEAEGEVLDVLVKSWRIRRWEQTDARIWIPAGDSGHGLFTILLARLIHPAA